VTESPLISQRSAPICQRERIESLYLVLPASPAERRRLASCDSDAAAAISIGRYNEWANRRESIGFCNQRPESLVRPATLRFIEADGAAAIRVPFGECKIHPITYPRAIASTFVLDFTIMLHTPISVSFFRGLCRKHTNEETKLRKRGSRKREKACR